MVRNKCSAKTEAKKKKKKKQREKTCEILFTHLPWGDLFFASFSFRLPLDCGLQIVDYYSKSIEQFPTEKSTNKLLTILSFNGFAHWIECVSCLDEFHARRMINFKYEGKMCFFASLFFQLHRFFLYRSNNKYLDFITFVRCFHCNKSNEIIVEMADGIDQNDERTNEEKTCVGSHFSVWFHFEFSFCSFRDT